MEAACDNKEYWVQRDLMVRYFKKDLHVEQRMPDMKPTDSVKISLTRTKEEM